MLVAFVLFVYTEAGVAIDIPPIKTDLRVSARDAEIIADRAAAKGSSFVIALLLDMGILPIRTPSPPAISNYTPRPSPSPPYLPPHNAGAAKYTYNSYPSCNNNNNNNKRTPPTTTSSLFNSKHPIILDEDLDLAKR